MKLPAVLALCAVLTTAAAPPLQRVELGADADHTDACGIWETTSSGTVFEISRTPGTRDDYTVTVVEAADYRLPPSTTIGKLTATAIPFCYDAEFSTDPLAGHTRKIARQKNCRFIIEFDKQLRSCTFKAYKKGKRISFHRMLPYLFRITVVDSDTRPQGIDGAIRIDSPPTPVIL